MPPGAWIQPRAVLVATADVQPIQRFLSIWIVPVAPGIQLPSNQMSALKPLVTFTCQAFLVVS